jgi:ACS family tartrate transporter-like MFS transporter
VSRRNARTRSPPERNCQAAGIDSPKEAGSISAFVCAPAPPPAEIPVDVMSFAPSVSPLDSARRKAYWRLLPLLFLCYVIAYVDRTNVGIAKLTMTKDLPSFDSEVFGLGFGLFFWGYFLLEVPCTVLVEKWSARRLISRIMITWGIAAAATALVRTPMQFYSARFLLGVAEAGFFPGVIVYLTHWFPNRDRTRALAYFMVATPFAQVLSPKISNALLKIGTDGVADGTAFHHPLILGMKGWQWIYVFWGMPAVVLGVIVLYYLPDRPAQATFLTDEEKAALSGEIAREKAARSKGKRMTLWEGLANTRVLLLALAYFLNVMANYTIEAFFPSILQDWFKITTDKITWLMMLPPCVAVLAQLFVGWNSDRVHERRLHVIIPLFIASSAIALAALSRNSLVLTIVCFMVTMGGLKAYLPAFWALPSLLLTQTAAAASIGFINSIGNLGGLAGPWLVGAIHKYTGSFAGGLYCLATTVALSAITVTLLNVGRTDQMQTVADANTEPAPGNAKPTASRAQ